VKKDHFKEAKRSRKIYTSLSKKNILSFPSTYDLGTSLSLLTMHGRGH
jgi:hypothetical protein